MANANRLTMVMVNFNATLGESMQGVVCPHHLERQTSDNGRRLVEFVSLTPSLITSKSARQHSTHMTEEQIQASRTMWWRNADSNHQCWTPVYTEKIWTAIMLEVSSFSTGAKPQPPLASKNAVCRQCYPCCREQGRAIAHAGYPGQSLCPVPKWSACRTWLEWPSGTRGAIKILLLK